MSKGAVAFSKLPDGRIVTAHWTKRWVDQGVGWSKALDCTFTLSLDGRALSLRDVETGKPVDALYFEEGWADGDRMPMPAVALGEGRFVVELDEYYSHHLGSVSSRVRLTIDTRLMTAEYHAEHTVDISD